MNKVEEIVEIVEKESPGLLDSISREDGITKESLVRKVLALSHGQMVRTHQSEGARHDSDVVVKRRRISIMKNIKEVMVSLMAIAACALPSYGSAEGVTNQISNCVNAHGEEMAAAGRELSRNNEAPDVEGGVVEPEFENEGEDTDVALGESVNEADRLFYLALAYQYGDHGLNQDYANAMRLYREAAEAGSPTAMANIGCMYRYGKGVVSNNTRAVYWFKKAAEAGDSLGTHQLALSEAFGIGAERDLTAGLFIRKISDWWRWRRIKMEIHEEVDANPGEESEIDEGRPDVNLDEYDDPMPSSAEETSEDGK